MAALSTVTDYVTAARTLLQDTVEPYRYPNADFALALGLGMLEARRLRPDLFLTRFDDIPSFDEDDVDADPAVDVTFDEQYRMALLYYICGHVQLRDEEDTQDARATVFLNKFTAQMLNISS